MDLQKCQCVYRYREGDINTHRYASESFLETHILETHILDHTYMCLHALYVYVYMLTHVSRSTSISISAFVFAFAILFVRVCVVNFTCTCMFILIRMRVLACILYMYARIHVSQTKTLQEAYTSMYVTNGFYDLRLSGLASPPARRCLRPAAAAPQTALAPCLGEGTGCLKAAAILEACFWRRPAWGWKFWDPRLEWSQICK